MILEEGNQTIKACGHSIANAPRSLEAAKHRARDQERHQDHRVIDSLRPLKILPLAPRKGILLSGHRSGFFLSGFQCRRTKTIPALRRYLSCAPGVMKSRAAPIVDAMIPLRDILA